MRRFFKRIASLFGVARAESELEREIEFHLQILQEISRRAGYLRLRQNWQRAEVEPLLGRLFAKGEDRAGANHELKPSQRQARK